MTIIYIFFAVALIIALKKPITMLFGILVPWLVQRKKKRFAEKKANGGSDV